MNDRFDQGSLELEVSNFGPIVEARIDLRPLTVFVGPSNTGKSYLAILIYALHRFFNSDGYSFRRHFSPIVRRFGTDPYREVLDSLRDLAREFASEQEATDGTSIVLPAPVSEWLLSRFDAQGDKIGDEVRRCFGLNEIGALFRKGRGNSPRIVLRREANNSAPVEHTLTLKARYPEFRMTVPAERPIQIGSRGTKELIWHSNRVVHAGLMDNERELEGEKWRLVGSLGELILPHFVGPLHLPAFYLPADRTGVMHAHSVVVSALIGSAPTAGLRPASHTPVLSGVLADFLGQLIEIDRPLRSPQSSRRRDPGRGIEYAILDGTIGVERLEVTGYPHFTYRPEGWKNGLSLMNASSMVSELAPVVLYLRHLVGPGSVLIVEEPESHLHPAMQVEFTRQLAALVKKGIRVIITTHSEWVLEELANIVRRFELSTPDRNTTEGAKIALHPDQVGAWLFKQKKRPKGSVVQEIKMDDETGLYPTDYDVVSEELYNESVNIFSRTQPENAK